MSKQPRVSHPIYSLQSMQIEGFDSLAELALDLRWSWNHATDDVWCQLDPTLWELTQNPWVVLQTVSRDKLESAWADPVFRKWTICYKPSVGRRKCQPGFSYIIPRLR